VYAASVAAQWNQGFITSEARDLLFDRLKRKQMPRPTEVVLVMTTYKFAMAQLKLRPFEGTSCQ
jgi:hypothetical protein